MQQHIYQWGNEKNTTLIFLHGLGSTGLAFGELAKLLAEYHVISFDLPGHGYAEALQEEKDYLPTNLIVEIEKIISQQQGNKSFYLIGHSLGAELALHVVARFPEQILGLILLDGGYLSAEKLGMTLESELQNVENFCNDTKFPSWEIFIESEKEELSRWSEELEAASRAQVKERDGEIQLTLSVFTAQSMIKGIYTEPAADILSRVNCPSLLIYATQPAELDTVRKEGIQDLQAKLNNLEVESIAEAGHDIFRDAPNCIAKKIKQWIHH
ncbi:alpha/beta fold hydrolase [Lysinibacillus sp. NPDC097231]|uniref:alpha/beta fold hydrolase n=1 Tax=Lysinibacillus sp. NPDC097231 TaxID=3364142 RepID=UPI0037FCEB46